jgi:hypothetical protein
MPKLNFSETFPIGIPCGNAVEFRFPRAPYKGAETEKFHNTEVTRRKPIHGNGLCAEKRDKVAPQKRKR